MQHTTTRVIPLKYTDSAQMLEQMTGGRKRGQLPPGIERLLHDPRTNSLIAQGTPEALDALKKQVARLDQSEGKPDKNDTPAANDPAQDRQKVPILSDIPLVGPLFRKQEKSETGVLLELRLVRFTFEQDGSWDVETVSNPKLITPNDTTATIELQDAEADFVVSLKPHIEPNGLLTLQGELTVRDDANSLKAYPAKFRQQVGQNMRGRRIPITGVTDARSGAIRKSVEMGRLPSPTPPAGSVLYYLQLTRVELTMDDSQRPADGGR